MIDALIVDTEDPTPGADCALPHCNVDGYSLPITTEADYRLILSTPTGLRFVDLCDDPQHDGRTTAELFPRSTALDPAIADLEASIEEAIAPAYWQSLIVAD